MTTFCCAPQGLRTTHSEFRFSDGRAGSRADEVYTTQASSKAGAEPNGRTLIYIMPPGLIGCPGMAPGRRSFASAGDLAVKAVYGMANQDGDILTRSKM